MPLAARDRLGREGTVSQGPVFSEGIPGQRAALGSGRDHPGAGSQPRTEAEWCILGTPVP